MNCKQGDLAYIKKALRSANIGRVVTCKTLLGHCERNEPMMYNGEQWFAVDTGIHWVVECPGGLETLYGKSIEGIILDDWLTPIKADPTELTEEIKELDLVE